MGGLAYGSLLGALAQFPKIYLPAEKFLGL
jgi:hypothetical protein